MNPIILQTSFVNFQLPWDQRSGRLLLGTQLRIHEECRQVESAILTGVCKKYYFTLALLKTRYKPRSVGVGEKLTFYLMKELKQLGSDAEGVINFRQRTKGWHLINMF